MTDPEHIEKQMAFLLQRFHGWVDKIIGAETNEQVTTLLAASEPEWQQ